MSSAQTTRLIRRFLDHGVVRTAPYQRHRFRARYTVEDIALLAEVDRAHERLSGRHVFQRETSSMGTNSTPGGPWKCRGMESRKNQKKEVGRYAASSFSYPLSLRSSGTDFMLIFRLENLMLYADVVCRLRERD